MANLSTIISTLITANHILHYHEVCDAYGHISARHPDNSSLFLMSADQAPALVSSADDLVTYLVEDASAVDPNAPRGYIERYIHSEMYKRYPDVNSVIHAHATDVLPYAISGVPMKPVFHMPAFLGLEIPVWDIEDAYNDTDKHDLLVRNEHEGASLATRFAAGENETIETSSPDRKVVLMRKHGFTTYGADIKTAVYRAVFTTENARAQTSSALLRSAFGNLAGQGVNLQQWDLEGTLMQNDFEPLTARQAADAEESIATTIERPWGLWVAEVEANPLYKNDG
jgi:ribulose-5-phosphate 4-epimerase/fuculose-1-phosphate aldolase